MFPLIVFSAINNLLFGVFMALMDAYGLSMVSVQAWGLLWGALSGVMIVGGLLITRTGLSFNPVRLILLINLVLWGTTVVFPLRDSIVWLTAGMVVYMALVPYVEAAEQTVLQKVVPYERRGPRVRVRAERRAGRLAADGVPHQPAGAVRVHPLHDRRPRRGLIGGWFGTGPSRGIALVFVITAMLGLVLTGFALSSRYYRQLSERYAASPAVEGAGATGAEGVVARATPDVGSQGLRSADDPAVSRVSAMAAPGWCCCTQEWPTTGCGNRRWPLWRAATASSPDLRGFGQHRISQGRSATPRTCWNCSTRSAWRRRRSSGPRSAAGWPSRPPPPRPTGSVPWCWCARRSRCSADTGRRGLR